MNWPLTHGATVQLCVKDMRDDWFADALEVLRTEGSDAWRVALKGA